MFQIPCVSSAIRQSPRAGFKAGNETTAEFFIDYLSGWLIQINLNINTLLLKPS